MSLNKVTMSIIVFSLLQLASFGLGFYSGQMLLTEIQKIEIAQEIIKKAMDGE